MVALAAEGRGLELVPRILEALHAAASHDPYLEALGAPDPSHCHGWGYAALIKREAWGLAFAKDDPGDCSKSLGGLARAAGHLASAALEAEAVLLILHARRAGREEPRGPLHAHPYLHVLSSADGARHLFLAHNGSVNKAEIGGELGLDARAYTDSHLSLLWLAAHVKDRALDAMLEVARRYTKSAYDAALLETAPGRDPLLHVVGYARLESIDEARRRYYEPVLVRGPGLVGYVSSTVRDLLGDYLGYEVIWNRGFTLAPGEIVASTTA